MILWQFPRFGDSITIYDITDHGKSTLIASLNKPDEGPQSYDSYSYWKKKIISSTSNKMLVEFRSDDAFESDGFSTSIHYSPLLSRECQKGLDMTKKTIQSPKYSDSYDKTMVCKWLISVPYNSHITLKFLQLDVCFLVQVKPSHCAVSLMQSFTLCKSFWKNKKPHEVRANCNLKISNSFTKFFYYSWKTLMIFLTFIMEVVMIQKW